ncbi:MAG: Ferric siderophore transport system, periplasmic binding protein TonB [Polyangiaceae bacterium]|jgi:protein TonB|nr:Ferric siderophore transport system, periplasmic binding protein TonB [Polyangiaceae bacterium]
MSLPVAHAQVSPLVAEIFDSAAPRRVFAALGWSVAIGAHLLAAGLALSEGRPAPPAPPPLEVELAQPQPPPPPPPEPVVTPPPTPDPVVAPTPVAKAAAAAPPEPARVGALLTAKADPTPDKPADEPVDFTNDPSLVGFGSGVVAIGGKAQVGSKNAALGPAPASTGTRGVAQAAGESLTPASNLSKKPGLGESDPCRGFFPSGAEDDVATAAVMVTIGRSGAVSSVQLLSESPPKQGFGAAARTCMAGKRFSPGLDRDGNPTATAIRVNIRFTR